MALENKLGITDFAQLAREEEKISKAKAKELFESGILDSLHPGTYVPYKIGKLQIQGFSEPITSKKIKQSYHITQKAARSRPRAAFLRGKLGRRQKFSKK